MFIHVVCHTLFSTSRTTLTWRRPGPAAWPWGPWRRSSAPRSRKRGWCGHGRHRLKLFYGFCNMKEFLTWEGTTVGTGNGLLSLGVLGQLTWSAGLDTTENGTGVTAFWGFDLKIFPSKKKRKIRNLQLCRCVGRPTFHLGSWQSFFGWKRYCTTRCVGRWAVEPLLKFFQN